MKKNYILPEIKIVKISASDVITSSLIAENDPTLTDDLLEGLEF